MQMRAQALRRLRIAGLIVVAVTATACSHVTGSKTTKNGKPLPCTYVAKLDQIANTVATADVKNPDTFKQTLDTAVHDYVQNVRTLRALAPLELRSGLSRVEADVQQYRFDAALTDRAALDAYAARTCGRVTSTASTIANGTTVTTSTPTAPSTVLTQPTAPVETTAPSDG